MRRYTNKGHPAYRAWVVDHYHCVNCGKRASDPAHVISRGAGGHDIGNVVAMCRKCHAIQHTQGWGALKVSHGDAALQAIRCAMKWYEQVEGRE